MRSLLLFVFFLIFPYTSYSKQTCGSYTNGVCTHYLIEGYYQTSDQASKACISFATSHGYSENSCHGPHGNFTWRHIQAGHLQEQKNVQKQPFYLGNFYYPHSSKPINNGKTCYNTQNPINISTTRKFLHHTDYKNSKFTVERFYNSEFGWTFNYRQNIYFSQIPGDYINIDSKKTLRHNVMVNRPDGKVLFFEFDGVNYIRPTNSDIKLELVSKNFLEHYSAYGDLYERSDSMLIIIDEVIKYKDFGITHILTVGNTKEFYDAQGRLLKIIDPGKPETNVSYNGDNFVVSNGDYNIAYEINENSDITKISLPNNLSLNYNYSYFNRPISKRLDSVKLNVDNNKESTLYDLIYENNGYWSKSLITGLQLGNLKRYLSITSTPTSLISELGNPGSGIDKVEVIANSDGTKTVVNPLGKRTTYHFTQFNGEYKPTKVEGQATANCAAANQEYTYDNNGNKDRVTDWNGIVTDYDYNERDLEVKRVEAVGTLQQRTITTEWHPELNVRTKITEPGLTTAYAYDAIGNPLTKTLLDTTGQCTGTSCTRTWRYAYNADNQLLSVDGPRTDVNDITTYTYNDKGDRASATNALGHTVTYNEYDAHGNLLKMTDANGVVTTLTYDLRQRLTSRTVAAGTLSSATTQFDYDKSGLLIKITQPNGQAFNYTYDQAQRLIGISDNAGNRIDYTLDNAGNRTAETVYDTTDTLKRTQQATFDELSRMIADIQGEGSMTTFTYDVKGNRISMTLPNEADGWTTRYQYDALDRLIKTIDPENGTASPTTYAYDQQDNLIEVKDPKGVTTRYNYNGFGDLITQNSPDTGVTSYTYDQAGNRAIQTDARGVTTQYQYDALNRLTAVTYDDASQNIRYTYDQATGAGYSTGQLIQLSDPSGTVDYQYDARGNVIQTTWTPLGAANNLRLTTTYTYDAADQVIAVTYPSGKVISYARNGLGQVQAVNLGNQPNGALLNQISYEPFGPANAQNYGNGLNEVQQYDRDGRLINKQAGQVQHLQWTYSPVGNIARMADLINPQNNQTFDYDGLQRLIKATGSYGTINYTYDAVGNRTEKAHNSLTETYDYAAQNNRLLKQVSSTVNQQYAYDNAGNPVKVGNQTYQYNAQNRLATIQQAGNTLASYTYSALGHRASKTLFNGKTTLYIYDQAGSLIAEHDANTGQVIQEYVYVNQKPVALLSAQAVSGPDKQTGQETIIDNTDSGYSTKGNWKSSSSVWGYYGDDYHYIKSSNANDITASWIPLLPASDYDVFAWWSANNKRTSEATYTVNHATGSTDVMQNQQTNSRQWNFLGNFRLDGTSSIDLQGTGNGFVIADAVRFVSKGSAQPAVTQSEVYYYHTDHLNTPQLLTDKNQNIVWQASMQPFGQADVKTEKVTNNLRFPGQYYDVETGKHYNYYRDYNPGTGRYLQSDPIGLQGGLNTYGYVYQSPLDYVDPYGLAVYLCSQPAFGIPWNPIDHQWIKTDIIEAGMGPAKSNCGNAGNESGDSLGDPVQVCDHSQRDRKNATCILIPGVDEDKVNNQLVVGRSLGSWYPWNQCQSFAAQVINNARPRVCRDTVRGRRCYAR